MIRNQQPNTDSVPKKKTETRIWTEPSAQTAQAQQHATQCRNLLSLTKT